MIYFLIAFIANVVEIISDSRKLRSDMNREHGWMAE
jgi:hypothetical protein